MKDFDSYYKHEERTIKHLIRKHFEKSKEPYRLTYDVTIKDSDDLKNKSIQHTIRLVAKKVARKKFSEAKKSKMFMIVPQSDGKMYKRIEIKKGIPVPVFAPEICEMKDITVNMLAVGLLKHLTTKTEENRDYYKNLLNELCPGIEKANLDIEYSELQKELIEDKKGEIGDEVPEVRPAGEIH
jgi:hypothetical protein